MKYIVLLLVLYLTSYAQVVGGFCGLSGLTATTIYGQPLTCYNGTWQIPTSGNSCTVIATPGTNTVQSVVNTLPTTGGTVCLQAGTYTITNAGVITLGTGTTTALSTINGIKLVGFSIPGTTLFGFNPTPAASIIDCSAITSPNSCITIQGVLEGWGLENLYLKGPSTAGNPTGAPFGLNVISGKWGNSRNLVFEGFNEGIHSDTLSSCTIGCTGNFDSLANRYENIKVKIPNNSNGFGVRLTGSNAAANTDYNTFVSVEATAANVGAVAFALDNTDSDTIYNLHCYGSGIHCIFFDYNQPNGQGANWPGGNSFFGVDLGTGGPGFSIVNNNGPAGTFTNYMFGSSSINGATCPAIANLMVVGCGQQRGTATLVAGTVTVSSTGACTPSATCTYHLDHCNSSGTVGTLSVGTVTVQTSFVINSSSGTDTSSVCWSIN